MLFDPEAAPASHADDPSALMWKSVIESVRRELGFPLEPELFSNMLVTALLGGSDDPRAPACMERLTSVFADTHVQGLYHFFSSHRFAGDVDCTATAVRARAAAGLPRLAAATDRILGSAAVSDRTAEENRSHGKDNGALRRHVFKVYLDDHVSFGPKLDRGLKHDHAVVANALFAVLSELKAGLRDLDDRVELLEFAQGSAAPRTGTATVREIVSANLRYSIEYLAGDAWRTGTRYYKSADAFLFFASELVREFEALGEATGLTALLTEAVTERRRSEHSTVPLDLALRANAVRNLGLDATAEQAALVRLQTPSGAWPGFGALYALGSAKVPAVYFGSEAVTVAFAARALARRHRPEPAADPKWWEPIV